MERRSSSRGRRRGSRDQRGSGSRGRSRSGSERHSRSLSRGGRRPSRSLNRGRRHSRSRGREDEGPHGGGDQRRSPTPPARAAEEPARYVAWSPDNMELLLATFADMIKLVEVERLLIAYNARTPAIRRGDVPCLTVLQGLLAWFKYSQYHLGVVERYLVQDGEDHLLLQAGELGEQAIQLISISNRNLLDAPEGGQEVARLREVYLRRHGCGLPLEQAAAMAWRRSAALSWFALYRAEEQGLAPHLHRLVEDLRDRRELLRMARRFELEPEEPQAGRRPADQAAGVQRQAPSPPPQAPPPGQQHLEGAGAALQQQQRQHQQPGGELQQAAEGVRVKLEPSSEVAADRPARRQQEALQPEQQQQQHQQVEEKPVGEQQVNVGQQRSPQQKEQQRRHAEPAKQAGERGGEQTRHPPQDNRHQPEERARQEQRQRDQHEWERKQREERERAEEKERRAKEERERQERRRREAREKEEAGRRQQKERQGRVEEERQRQERAVPPRSARPQASSMAAAPTGTAPAVGGAAAGSEFPPHLAHLADPNLLRDQQQQQHSNLLRDQQQQQHYVAGQQQLAQAVQPAGSDLPPHLARTAAPVPGVSPGLAPAFIPLAGTPAGPEGHSPMHPVPAQEQQQQLLHSGGADAGGGGQELQAARQAAVAAAQRSRDPRMACGTSDRPGSSGAAKRSASPMAAGKPHAAPPASAAVTEGSAAAASSKRKRAAIQWEPQPQREGDAPLQRYDSDGALIKPDKQQKAAAAPAAPAAAGAPAAAKPKAAPPAKPPKGFSITVRNVPADRDASPSVSEEGELRPAKAARQDAGPSRLATAGPARHQQQAHQQQSAAAAAGLAYPAPAQLQELTFPPGFGGGDLQVPSSTRAVGAEATDSVTVRFSVPGAGPAGYGGAVHRAQQARYTGDAGVPPGLPLLQQLGFPADAGLAQQQAAALYGAGLLQPGTLEPFDDRYAQAALAAASLAPSPTAIFFAGAMPPAQQHQQHLGGLQQHVNGLGGPGDLSAGFGGGADLPPHLLAGAASPAGVSGRVVQVEGGGGGRGGSGKGSGGGKSGGDAGNGGGGGRGGRAAAAVTGDACWDPMVSWEVRLIEVLRQSPKGISMEELHRRHPLPAFMPQSLGALKHYVMMRKQLCVVDRPERDRPYHLVSATRSAEAWLVYKRALLQLLADRRPRVEAGAVQRQLALPSRLPEYMHKEAKHDFPAFVAKFLKQEVQVLAGPHGRGALLELRPFAAGAGGPGFPRLHPPFGEPCTAEACTQGDRCRFAHAQPRSY